MADDSGERSPIMPLPGKDLLEKWTMRNFSHPFDHDAAMAYREETRDAFERKADLLLDSILGPAENGSHR